MYKITVLGSEPRQNFKVILDGGEFIDFEFYYSESQTSWFFSFTYKERTAKNIRLTNCPNIIREFQDCLPFGISCTVNDGLEPDRIDDFETQRAVVYVLEKDEVQQVERDAYGQLW